MASISLQQLKIVEDQLYIAHGYFDINAELVWDVVKNDLGSLREAIDYLLSHLYELIKVE